MSQPPRYTTIYPLKHAVTTTCACCGEGYLPCHHRDPELAAYGDGYLCDECVPCVERADRVLMRGGNRYRRPKQPPA